MKRQTRIVLGLAGFAAAAALYPCFAAAQIATPVVTAIPGAKHEVPFELFRDSRIFLNGRVNGTETSMILDSGAGVTTHRQRLRKADRPEERHPADSRRASADESRASSFRT